MKLDERLLSVEEVTQRLGVSRSTVDRMTHTGKLTAVRLGGRVLFRERDLAAVIGEPGESSSQRYATLRARLMDLLDEAERYTEDVERIRSKLARKGGEPAFRRLRAHVLKAKESALQEAKTEVESIENELSELLQRDASLPPVFGQDTVQVTELRRKLRAVLDDADQLRRVMKRPAGLGPADELRQQKLRELNAEAEHFTKLIARFDATREEAPAPDS